MASASTQTGDFDEDEFQAQVRRAIEIVVAQINSSRNQPQGQPISLNSNFDQIIPKIHEILTKLDALSQGLQGFTESSSLNSTFVTSFSHVHPTDILHEIEGYKKHLEHLIRILSRLHSSSNDIFITLVQMAINGIEIPSVEELHSPPVSLSTILKNAAAETFQSAVQQTNVTREVIRSLIHRLSVHFAVSSSIEQPLIYLSQFFVSAFMSSIKLSEEAFHSYLQLARDENLDFNIELSTKIRDSFMMVNASVKRCKEGDPDARDLAIVDYLSNQPASAGLVHPIVSFLNCSEQRAWAIILQVYSQVH